MRKIRFFLILTVFTVFFSGCTLLKQHSRQKNRLTVIAKGDIQGLNKVDLVKKLGNPSATSKSGSSECWYYAKPTAIWVWFKDNAVEHWEVE